MGPVRRLRKVLLDTPSGTLLPQVERVDYALDRSIRYARRSLAGRRTPNLWNPQLRRPPYPQSLRMFASADRGRHFGWRQRGPSVRCTKPCRAAGSAGFRGRPATRAFPGSPGLYEGRNPLSETTEVTADVTNGGAAAEAAVAER